MATRSMILLHGRISALSRFNCRRRFGGYIEDAQLAMLGEEIYRDLNGVKAIVPSSFVVPDDDEQWPSNLWGYKLGEGVNKHLVRSKD